MAGEVVAAGPSSPSSPLQGLGPRLVLPPAALLRTQDAPRAPCRRPGPSLDVLPPIWPLGDVAYWPPAHCGPVDTGPCPLPPRSQPRPDVLVPSQLRAVPVPTCPGPPASLPAPTRPGPWGTSGSSFWLPQPAPPPGHPGLAPSDHPQHGAYGDRPLVRVHVHLLRAGYTVREAWGHEAPWAAGLMSVWPATCCSPAGTGPLGPQRTSPARGQPASALSRGAGVQPLLPAAGSACRPRRAGGEWLLLREPHAPVTTCHCATAGSQRRAPRPPRLCANKTWFRFTGSASHAVLTLQEAVFSVDSLQPSKAVETLFIPGLRGKTVVGSAGPVLR